MAYRRRRGYRPYARRPSDRFIRAATLTAVGNLVTKQILFLANETGTCSNWRFDIQSETPIVEPIAYAVVYYPEGTTPGDITYPALSVDLYNPTKFVLFSGVLGSDNQDEQYSRYARKFSRGDGVAVIINNTNNEDIPVAFKLSWTQTH